MLKELQALRQKYGSDADDNVLYWVLTIAIDIVLGLDTDGDIARLEHSIRTRP